MNKKTLGRDQVPQGFTLSMVLVDAVPVVLFGLACIAISARLSSPVFLVGACVSLAAGVGKVLWKLIVVTARRSVWLLNRQLRVVMPLGFLLMLAGAVIAVATGTVGLADVAAALTALPSGLLFLAWVALMGFMGYLGARLDPADTKANWTEQLVNAAAQAALLAGVLLLP